MVRACTHNGLKKKKKNAWFRNKSPKFFKLIPPAFIEHFNGTIPSKVILKDISGRCTHVELEELKDGLVIDSGWQGFVNDHSIEHGDFLIFKDNGEPLFDVTIFGTHGCIKEEAVITSKCTPKPIPSVKIEEETEAAVKPSSRSTPNCKRKVSEVGKKKMERFQKLAKKMEIWD